MQCVQSSGSEGTGRGEDRTWLGCGARGQAAGQDIRETSQWETEDRPSARLAVEPSTRSVGSEMTYEWRVPTHDPTRWVQAQLVTRGWLEQHRPRMVIRV